jgi:hypothetical protein
MRLSFRGIAATAGLIAALATSSAASAAPIAAGSAFDIAGGVRGLGVGAGTINVATGFDFRTGSPTGFQNGLNTPGTISLISASGDLIGLEGGCSTAASAGGCGTIIDLPTFTPTLPINNFISLTSNGLTVSFDLDTLVVADRNPGNPGAGILPFITIGGTGSINFTGFDETAAVFTLTAQGDRITSFSATSQAVPTEVPEPASLLLLGAGLLGLAAMRRRR